MKRIAIYTSILAVLGTAACSHSEDTCVPATPGSELVVRAELVSTSDWITTRSESGQIWGTATESTDGEYLIIAEKQAWTGVADTLTAEAPVTRGTPIISTAGIANLRVNVFKTGTANWTASSALTTAINATNVSGSFTTSPGYNWPTDAMSKTTLFAYSPVPTSDNGLTESASNKIAYTVPSDVTKQPDLCVAPPSMNIVNSDGVQQVRTFALSHQLTAVGFTMMGWNLKVTQITVSGVAVTGTLTVNTSTGAHTWALGGTGSRNVGVTGSSYQHNVNNSYANITTSNGYLMMIPQTLTDAATVTITYASTGTGSAGGTITANLKDLALTWNAGDKITYNIRLKTAPAVTNGDLTIENDKAGYTTSSPLLFLMDNRDNLTFTWDATWLKIHRGAPKAGDTSGGAPSGWQTGTGGPWGNIYFFATSDNSSTIADRTATVTVSGTRSGSKTFVVKQKRLLDNGWISNSALTAAGWPADKLPMEGGLQLAKRGNIKLDGTAIESDPGVIWSTENIVTGALTNVGMGKASYAMLGAKNSTQYPIGQACKSLGADWYVPSRDELALIYRNKALLGPSYTFQENDYSCISEMNYNSHWMVNFSNGSESSGSKRTPRRIRCVKGTPPPPAGSYIPRATLQTAGWPAGRLPAYGLQVAAHGNLFPGSASIPGNDESTITFWSQDMVTTGATADGFGTGKDNYARLSVLGTNFPVGQACKGLGSEWYVPSLNELRLIAKNNVAFGASYTFDFDMYMSSTEIDKPTAWFLRFDRGGSSSLNLIKNQRSRVRCVREI